MDDWTEAVHAYLTTAASSQFLHRSVEILEQWQGRDNLLWRVRASGSDGSDTDAVLKLFTDAGQARSRRQFSGQQQFAAAGLAPQPLWYDRYPPGLPRQVLIYRWAEGDPLTLADPFHRDGLAEAVAQIHRADAGDVQRFSPHPFNLLTFWQVWQPSQEQLRQWLRPHSVPLLDGLLADVWSAVQTALDDALPAFGETPPTPVHGELAPENGLFQRGRVLLLDWEFFGLGDPAQEIARFLFYSQEAWPGPADPAEWLDAYSQRAPQPGLQERVQLYQRLLTFQAATFLLEGIRQSRGSAGANRADPAAVRGFLQEALTAALLRSRQVWALPPLTQTDRAGLTDELQTLLDVHLTGES